MQVFAHFKFYTHSFPVNIRWSERCNNIKDICDSPAVRPPVTVPHKQMNYQHYDGCTVTVTLISGVNDIIIYVVVFIFCIFILSQGSSELLLQPSSSGPRSGRRQREMQLQFRRHSFLQLHSGRGKVVIHTVTSGGSRMTLSSGT